MDTLAEMRRQHDNALTYDDHHNAIWGEMDWLEELHRILHGIRS